jgi:uncharacterized protein YbcI
MEGDPKALGHMRAMISKEIVRLQAEYYGKGPTKAKTYIVDDLVVVVLEESFTRAETICFAIHGPIEVAGAARAPAGGVALVRSRS